MNPFVTIIVPCRNEEKYISQMLDNIVQQDYDKSLLEVLVMDGLSTDRTAEIINEFSNKFQYIKYYENKYRQVSFALNSGIALARGEIIIRMDAHCLFPTDYISALVTNLIKTNAENVGGVFKTVPADNSIKSFAIAKAMSSSFGVGNSFHRIGIDSVNNVDTVPFGCFRKEIFSKIGLFDTELFRNQDDEFNGRIIKSGGTVVMIPEIKIIYYARESLTKLYNMFYQYGLFKPLVNIKLGSSTSIRQFFPFLFTLYLLSILPFFLLTPKPFSFIYLSVLFFYICINLCYSVKITLAHSKPLLIFYLPICYFLIHLSYGIGYINGLIRFSVLKTRIDNEKFMPSR